MHAFPFLYDASMRNRGKLVLGLGIVLSIMVVALAVAQYPNGNAHQCSGYTTACEGSNWSFYQEYWVACCCDDNPQDGNWHECALYIYSYVGSGPYLGAMCYRMISNSGEGGPPSCEPLPEAGPIEWIEVPARRGCRMVQ